MSSEPVTRDERTIAVENASYRLAYLVLSFGLLAAIAYRAFFLDQPSWDLFALVVIGGGIATFYQMANRIIPARWKYVVVGIILLAAGVAYVTVLLIGRLH